MNKEKDPLIRIKQKYQITLPKKARKILCVSEGDYLNFEVKDGFISLKPEKERAKTNNKIQHSLSKYIGSATKSDDAAKEAADFIRELRNEWKEG